MNKRLSEVLKKINRKRTFQTFAQAILKHHKVLKDHFVFNHDEYYGDCYDFDFRKQLTGRLAKKFDLLIHVLDFDETGQTETLLRELNWFKDPVSTTNTNELIQEAIRDGGRISLIEPFHNFEYDAWRRFCHNFMFLRE